MFGSDIGHGRGNRVQNVVAGISAAQARACKRHDLAIAHILVSKSRSAARQTHDVTHDRATHRTRQRRRGVIAVVLLVVRREAARDVFGSYIGGGRRDRVQNVITGIKAA